MDSNVEQNFEVEEGAEAATLKKKRRHRTEQVASTKGHERDSGEWRFKPWQGLDHWVHEGTRASTFDLKKIK